MTSRMSTSNRLQTHWSEVKKYIKKEWPLLSDTAVGRIHGNYDVFLKYLKESYGNFPLEEAKARDKLQRFLNNLDRV